MTTAKTLLNPPARFAALISLLFALFAALPARAEPAVLRVVVNGMDQGDRVVELTGEGDVRLPPGDFAALGFAPLAEGLLSPEDGTLSLSSLAPGLLFQVESQTATLRIDASPELFGTTVLYMSRNAPTSPLRDGRLAVILNGYPEIWYSDSREESIYRIPAELTVSAGRLAFTTDYLYSRDGEERSVRLLSHLSADDPNAMTRWRVGDVAASSGRLGGAALLGGVSLRRAFFMQPYFRPYAGTEYLGSTLTPARVEVWVNDVYFGAEEVPPGEFQVGNIPALTGTGDMRVVVTDKSGNRRVLEGDYFASNRLLKAGLDDYQLSAGWRRAGLGVESFDYREPLLLGQGRHGFSNRLTAGVNVEASRRRANLGSEAVLHLDALGELGLAAAVSRQGPEKTGGAASVDFLHQRPGFSLDASARYRTRDYSNQSLDADADKARWEGRLGGSVWLAGVGTLGLFATAERFYEEPTLRRQELLFHWPIGRGYTLVARTGRATEGDDVSWEGYLSVQGSFGGVTGAAEHADTAEGERQSLQLKKSPKDDRGVGFEGTAVRLDRDGGGVEGSGTALIDYRGEKGILFTGYRRVGEDDSYGAGGYGALVWFDGSLFLTRPVYDAFALVRLEGLPNVRIYRNNVLQGRTDAEGEFLVGGLSSYATNRVSVEDEDIPLDYRLDGGADSFAPGYRNGILAELPVRKLQAVVGRLFLRRGEERKPAEFARLVVGAGGEARRSVVGRGGEFYLEELAWGDYDVELSLEGVRCRTRLTVPPVEETFVDIGEIDCEIP